MAGATHWIGWEMRKVIDLGDAEKTIILFPQTKNRWRLFRRGQTTTPEVRLSVVQGAFMGTVWETGLLQLTDAQRIRSLFFEPGGRVTAITSKPKNRDSYHLAAIISHYLIRMRAQPELELGPAVLDAPLSAPLAPLGARAFAAFIDAAVFVSLCASFHHWNMVGWPAFRRTLPRLLQSGGTLDWRHAWQSRRGAEGRDGCRHAAHEFRLPHAQHSSPGRWHGVLLARLRCRLVSPTAATHRGSSRGNDRGSRPTPCLASGFLGSRMPDSPHPLFRSKG